MPGRIPPELIDEIRDRTDIVALVEGYAPLKQRGSDFWACCPFHKEKTPSFKVSPSHQTYYCFGCKKSGNVFQFVMEQENIDFVGAVRLLARRANVRIPEEPPSPSENGERPSATVPREKLYDLLSAIGDWYVEQLNRPEAQAARDYLDGRGLDQEIVKEFGLGYSPNAWDAAIKWAAGKGYDERSMVQAGLAKEKQGTNRVYDAFRGRLMFPIKDATGQIIGFSARTLEKDAKTAKYINTPETAVFHKGKILYGLCYARQSLKNMGYALVCEGQLDVIACHRAGLTNAVAPQGTAFTEQQARVLKRYTDEVTFAFDADEAGEKAAKRSLQVALAADLRAKVVMLPPGEDPDSIFQSGGAEDVQKRLRDSHDAMAFLFELLKRDLDLASPAGKDAVVQGMLEVISTLPSPVVRASHCQWVSTQAGVPETAVFEAMNRVTRGRQRRARFRNNDNQPNARPDRLAQMTPATTSTDTTGPAVLALLDLALHHEQVARRLAENDTITADALGESPPAQALILVLRKTAETDFDNAAAAIGARQDLVGDPAVAEAMHRSRYPGPGKEASEYERERYEKLIAQATQDCIEKIEGVYLDRQRQKLEHQWQTEQDPDRARTIGKQLSELRRRQHRLCQSRV
ncbi:MAG: DNA primase [Kiritimatiellales bacterium]|nr:DNA primase [Kiritimatiellales bacterium]